MSPNVTSLYTCCSLCLESPLCWSVFVYFVSPLPPQDHKCRGQAGLCSVHYHISRAENSTRHRADNICWENNRNKCCCSKWGQERSLWEHGHLKRNLNGVNCRSYPWISGESSFWQGLTNSIALPPLRVWVWQEVRQVSCQVDTKMSPLLFIHITNIFWVSTMWQLCSRG